jgi:chondroitin 4-sulfotransferase 11
LKVHHLLLPPEVRAKLAEWRTVQQRRARGRKLREVEEKGLKAFDVHKSIFIHVPKTGGISVGRSLFGEIVGSHFTADDYKAIFGRENFQNYFKFAFVRNPWDRAVSAYSFFKTGTFSENTKRWGERHLADYPDFGSFVKGWLNPDIIFKTSKAFMPQYVFVCDKALKPQVDFLGHYEHLQRDFETIRERLGIQAELQHLNASRRKDYREYYTKETRDIIAELYRKDIEIFGYDFDHDTH